MELNGEVANPAYNEWLKTLHLQDPNIRGYTLRLRNHWDWVDMAQDGWYYLGMSDWTRCVSCGGALNKWEGNRDPLWRHLAIYPWCSHAQRRLAAWETIVRAGESEKHFHNPGHVIQYPLANPVTPDMAGRMKRLSTFFRAPWIPRAAVSASAGFFWTGRYRGIECYYCGGQLVPVDPYGNRFIEHARRYPDCQYINRYLGPQMVKVITEYYGDHLRMQPSPAHDVTDKVPSAALTIESSVEANGTRGAGE